MAYVVKRGANRWEFRESNWTPNGPRSRTLASFRRMSDDVADKASSAARHPPSRRELWQLARRAGVPEAELAADAAARVILARAARGVLPSPGLRDLLRRAFDGSQDEGVGRWAGASPEQRGIALYELLRLADAIPPRPHAPLKAALGKNV
jgi:hypothetical protein